jgi:aspartate-semialdehyde dehydrogenase
MEHSTMEEKKIEAEIAKLMAETMKIQAEAKWYPFVVTSAVFAAAIGVVKMFM